jgi:hypothetical protein
MARRSDPAQADAVSYYGEVWTDARGFATVSVPMGAERLLPPLEYELRNVEPPSTARVTGELDDGRFTIATDEPHVMVGWRISGRRDRTSERARSSTTEGGIR